ncbi:MAG TPA: isoprenyl transferase [Bacteroidales bacterium]|nr:isoprenyl transferase [Bacteroidales bacterium]
MDLKNKIDLDRLPRHIAIIMDGNGRWAKQRGKPRTFGHQSGVTSVRETTEAATELGVEYLTLYAFSTENWSRPKFETDALMTLLLQTIHKETKTLNKNNVRLRAIGDLDSLPDRTRKQLERAVENTAGNNRMTLVLALSYSARWEIINAVKNIGMEIENGNIQPGSINQEIFSKYLVTADIPDPELLIRTSGEFRISNFLLWQIAYTELYFSEKLWPDFRKDDLYRAIIDYQARERRFGKISEQIKAE